MTAKLSPASVAYRKWYKKNRKSFNAARAKRYVEDEDYRNHIKDKQNLYRLTIPRVPADGHHHRVIGGKKLEVFRITATAEMIGYDPQTIRTWEGKGWIPKPTIKSVHRYYTKNQVKLLKEFAELSTLVRWERSIRPVAIANKSVEVKALWAGR